MVYLTHTLKPALRFLSGESLNYILSEQLMLEEF